MTNRCKFGLGNSGLAQVAMGTASMSNHPAVAAQMQTCRPQRKRTRCSSERSRGEGRAGGHHAKAIMVSSSAHVDGTTSPLLQWWHAGKAVGVNSGDRILSRGLVAPSISMSEVMGKAVCGVGGAHSIDEAEDSITSEERRGLTWCMPVRSSGGAHSPTGVRGIVGV